MTSNIFHEPRPGDVWLHELIVFFVTPISKQGMDLYKVYQQPKLFKQSKSGRQHGHDRNGKSGPLRYPALNPGGVEELMELLELLRS